MLLVETIYFLSSTSFSLPPRWAPIVPVREMGPRELLKGFVFFLSFGQVVGVSL